MTSHARFITLISALFVFVGLPVAASAQTIGLVNMKTVFDSYWKTKQGEMNLYKLNQDYGAKVRELQDELKQIEQEHNALATKASDPALNTESREKFKKDAEAKVLEGQEISQTLRQYGAQAEARLTEEGRQIREKILKEIKDIVEVKARNAGYSLVLDTAAETVNRTPAILYTDGRNDLTKAVIEHLNLSSPAGFWENAKQFDEKKKAAGQ